MALAEGVLEYQPENLEALLVLAAAQFEMGLDRRARATAERIRRAFPAADVGAWLDANPYRQPEVIERWRDDLATVGVLGD